MYHPSEWARYFDEKTGSYRYKHKGSGVIRDTFMTIGKVLKKMQRMLQKKLLKKPQKQLLKKRVRKLVNLRNYCKREKKVTTKRKKTVVTKRKKETCKYFAKPNTKKIRRSCEIKSNFGK